MRTMLGPFARCAEHLLAGGYSPVPLLEGEKRPLLDKWDHLRTRAMTASEIAHLVARRPDLGLGVAGGFNDLVPVDVDSEAPTVIDAATSILPRTTVAKVGLRGFTGFYRGKVRGRKIKDGKQMLIEVLATGQTVLPPTMHPGKPLEGIAPRPYRWLTEATLFNTHVSELPVVTEEHFERLERVLLPAKQAYVRPAYSDAPPPNLDDLMMRRMASKARAILRADVGALGSMGKDSGRNYALFLAVCRVGKFVHHGIIGRGEMETALIEACRSNGVVAEDGMKQCRDSIESALKTSKNDPLPSLSDGGDYVGNLHVLALTERGIKCATPSSTHAPFWLPRRGDHVAWAASPQPGMQIRAIVPSWLAGKHRQLVGAARL